MTALNCHTSLRDRRSAPLSVTIFIFEILYKKLFVKLIVVENNSIDKVVQIYTRQNTRQEVSLQLL
jgi:hypothetical protein